MSMVEKVLGLMLGLILVYLLVKNASAVNQIFTSLAGAAVGIFGTLQGREKISAFGVELGG